MPCFLSTWASQHGHLFHQTRQRASASKAGVAILCNRQVTRHHLCCALPLGSRSQSHSHVRGELPKGVTPQGRDSWGDGRVSPSTVLRGKCGFFLWACLRNCEEIFASCQASALGVLFGPRSVIYQLRSPESEGQGGGPRERCLRRRLSCASLVICSAELKLM